MSETHPILAAAADIGRVLTDVAEVNPVFMAPEEKAAALAALVAVQGRLVELKLRVLAVAAEVAEQDAARDAAAWLAEHTGTSHDTARTEARLAEALDRRYPALAAGMREGTVHPDQAHVITRALDNLADLAGEVDPATLTAAETHLVGQCERFGPRQLALLGRRILHVVAPDLADAAEARRLEALEATAAQKTRLTLRRCGDGTTRLTSLLPDATATRLATYLEAFTNTAWGALSPWTVRPRLAARPRLQEEA